MLRSCCRYRCFVASRTDRGDSVGWLSTKARTHPGSVRANWRSAHPMPLRMKKSRSPRFASIAVVSSFVSVASLKVSWQMIDVRRRHKSASVDHVYMTGVSSSGELT